MMLLPGGLEAGVWGGGRKSHSIFFQYKLLPSPAHPGWPIADPSRAKETSTNVTSPNTLAGKPHNRDGCICT